MRPVLPPGAGEPAVVISRLASLNATGADPTAHSDGVDHPGEGKSEGKADR